MNIQIVQQLRDSQAALFKRVAALEGERDDMLRAVDILRRHVAALVPPAPGAASTITPPPAPAASKTPKRTTDAA